MKITFKTSNFTLNSGSYYSPAFYIQNNDNYMSVVATLSGSGDVSLERSVDEISWFPIADSTIACAPSGMQSYSDCQPELLYRLVSETSFVGAVIVI